MLSFPSYDWKNRIVNLTHCEDSHWFVQNGPLLKFTGMKTTHIHTHTERERERERHIGIYHFDCNLIHYVRSNALSHPVPISLDLFSAVNVILIK